MTSPAVSRRLTPAASRARISSAMAGLRCRSNGWTVDYTDYTLLRGFLATAAACAVALRVQNRKHIPVGLLIYAILADWKKDFSGTLTTVALMGYEGVELAQYESWTPARAKEVRSLLDSIGDRTESHCQPACPLMSLHTTRKPTPAASQPNHRISAPRHQISRVHRTSEQ